MKMRITSLAIVILVLALFSIQSFAQSVRRQAPAAPPDQEQSASLPATGNSIEAVANEIDLLRKSLQTLNTRLREISDKLSAPDGKQSDDSNDKQKRIALNLDLLARAEDRAGILRRQLLDLIEKESSYRARLAQLDEDTRPENIERALNGIGTTRTAELRDVRRRSLEFERRGLESLLNLTTQSRIRLDEDVRQADSLVSRLRQRLLPLIDKEIESINPN
jgi:predicted  nucleic acid-binding Zn-ribbon protein